MSMIFLVAITLSSPSASVNPLAPSVEGKFQCYQPDDVKKTCQSLAAYRPIDKTTYYNTAVVLLSKARPVTLETTTPVTLKEGAVCGAIRAEDISTGKLRIDGHLLEGAQATTALASVAQSMQPLMNKEICTSYEPAIDGFTAKISIDGVYQNQGDLKVRWVTPEDGYVVSP